MIKKLLIANRGEIACRIIRSAQKLGMKTVAVYSEPDARSLHVEQADEAVSLGGSTSRESYLNIEKILDACRKTGANAVHPGFGFLSERSDFILALEKEGIIFVGPSAEAVRLMGDKIISKQTARKANVSTVPGFDGEISDVAAVLREARSIGYPVIIKASAGGGGKGMRIARNDREAEEGLTLARSEAAASFGDDRVFIEKYIEKPRHIEIQILGDQHGNIVHLFERECSVQRRHQKVVEEAPSKFVTPEMREKMGAQSVALAKAVGYYSAGTVEFVVSPAGDFYFLEMNTRIQVEHPVTELITGVDLIELSLRIAEGAALPFKQEDLRINGHALECRIYAEDPYHNFAPSVGRLKRYRPPVSGPVAGGGEIRLDSGVYEGAEVSAFYDPMLAKLCTHAPSRDQAIEIMLDALDGFELEGITPNIDFTAAICNHAAFRAGDLSTDFIPEHFGEEFTGSEIDAKERGLISSLTVYYDYLFRTLSAEKIFLQSSGAPFFIDIGTFGKLDNRLTVACEIDVKNAVNIALSCAEETQFFNLSEGVITPASRIFRANVNGVPVTVKIYRTEDGYLTAHRGAKLKIALRSLQEAEVADLMLAKKDALQNEFISSPTPGVLKSIFVNPGDHVRVGANIAAVEAMKMENILKSKREGVIEIVYFSPGDSVNAGAPLIKFFETETET